MTNYEQLSGHGAPSNKTVGNVGQMYVDLDTGKEYICAKIFTVTGYKIKRELYSWVARELDPDEYATLTWARFAAPYVFKTDEEVETTIDRIKDNMSNKDKWNESVLLKSVTAALPTSVLWSSVTYGDGKFVAVAYDSNIAAYSTDGITWTQATLPTTALWRYVTYGDGKFVAVAYENDIAAYSTDGINWTKATLPTTAFWASVTYGDGKFVAVADENDIAAYSTDGINWHREINAVETVSGEDVTDKAKKILGLDNGVATPVKSVTITLTSSGWDSTALTQTITVSGVLEDEASQLIQPVPAIASQTAYIEAGILCTGQAADNLTFTANTVPTEDLTVYVTIQEVTQE